MAKNTLDWIFLVLLIIGGINWGLVGLLDFNLVTTLFSGSLAIVAKIVYIIVGISALYTIYFLFKK
ncbi:MAG: DUF378 domain-containing protein [Candidatus Pacearchaeota archaeon]|jgi:hypothetical protein